MEKMLLGDLKNMSRLTSRQNAELQSYLLIADEEQLQEAEEIIRLRKSAK